MRAFEFIEKKKKKRNNNKKKIRPLTTPDLLKDTKL